MVHMLRLGIKPIAVFDGKPPAAKHRASPMKGADNHRFRYLGGRVQSLLYCLGVPCISEDQVEAETLCAEMQSAGLVDAVATEDGDCLLFGARCVLRNFRADGDSAVVS